MHVYNGDNDKNCFIYLQSASSKKVTKRRSSTLRQRPAPKLQEDTEPEDAQQSESGSDDDYITSSKKSVQLGKQTALKSAAPAGKHLAAREIYDFIYLVCFAWIFIWQRNQTQCTLCLSCLLPLEFVS